MNSTTLASQVMLELPVPLEDANLSSSSTESVEKQGASPELSTSDTQNGDSRTEKLQNSVIFPDVLGGLPNGLANGDPTAKNFPLLLLSVRLPNGLIAPVSFNCPDPVMARKTFILGNPGQNLSGGSTVPNALSLNGIGPPKPQVATVNGHSSPPQPKPGANSLTAGKKKRRKKADLLTAPKPKKRASLKVDNLLSSFPASIAVDGQQPPKPKKPRVSKKYLSQLSNHLSLRGPGIILPPAEIPSSLAVPHRTRAVAWISRIPPDSSSNILISAFKKSQFSAVVSATREPDSMTQLKNNGLVFEDRDVVWDPLPTAAPLMMPGLSPAAVGDLLSFGHFVEVIQDGNTDPRYKVSIDLGFLREAVCLKDGSSTGPYLYLLGLLYCAFKEINPSFQLVCDFTGRADKMDADSLMASEFLRLYLLAYCNADNHFLTPEFVDLVKKLDVTDVAEVSAEDRVTILHGCQEILLRGTFFIAEHFSKLTQTKEALTAESKMLAEQIVVISAKLEELRTEKTVFDEWSAVNQVSRTVGRQQDTITADFEEAEKNLADKVAKRLEVEKSIRETQDLLNYSKKSCHLGYDRHHDRYWYFPNLYSGILVESGWFVPIKPSKVSPDPPTAGPLINFTIPKGPRSAAEYRNLYRLNADGTHRACYRDPEYWSSPVAAECGWKLYSPDSLPLLQDALCPFGAREHDLSENLMRTEVQMANHVPSRPMPSLSDLVPYETIKSEIVEITNGFVDSQFLNTEFEWTVRSLDGITLPDLKKHILWLHFRILKPILKRALHATPSCDRGKGPATQGDLWRAAVRATNSLPRFAYLIAVLKQAIDWDYIITPESTCDCCERRENASDLIRCHQCLEVFHEQTCALFEDYTCHFCRDFDCPVRIVDFMGPIDEKTSQSPRKVKAAERRIDPVVKEEWEHLEKLHWLDDVEEDGTGPYSLRAKRKNVSYEEGTDDDESEEETEGKREQAVRNQVKDRDGAKTQDGGDANSDEDDRDAREAENEKETSSDSSDSEKSEEPSSSDDGESQTKEDSSDSGKLQVNDESSDIEIPIASGDSCVSRAKRDDRTDEENERDNKQALENGCHGDAVLTFDFDAEPCDDDIVIDSAGAFAEINSSATCHDIAL